MKYEKDYSVVPRMNTLHESIQNGELKKIKVGNHDTFKNLDWKGILALEKLQNQLFLGKTAMVGSEEGQSIRNLYLTGGHNIDILENMGFERNKKRKTLDFFGLCESLFEKYVPIESIGDITSEETVNIINEN